MRKYEMKDEGCVEIIEMWRRDLGSVYSGELSTIVLLHRDHGKCFRSL